jgi:hypothetical protein
VTLFWSRSAERGWRDSGGSPIESVAMQSTKTTDIPKVIAQEAYKEYADQGHGAQSFDRLHERGGFGDTEIILLLFERIQRLSHTQEGQSK